MVLFLSACQLVLPFRLNIDAVAQVPGGAAVEQCGVSLRTKTCSGVHDLQSYETTLSTQRSMG
jgi:hypothetical protein